MAEDFAGGAPLVVVLGDNIFEYAQSASLREWAERPIARADLRQGGRRSRELRRGRLRRRRAGDGHRREGRRRGHAVRRCLRRATRWSVSTAIPPDVFDVIATLEPVRARRARDHRREPPLRARRTSRRRRSRRAGGRTPASTGSTSPTSAIASTRRAPTSERRVIDGLHRIPLRASRTNAAGSASFAATARCRSRCGRRTSRSRAPG